MESITDLLRVLQVALGIGLVIFVHEGGHFLAARWCGVRVEVFSLGFGPPLLSWRRGATRYQIAMIPLGGYVRMAGEDRRFTGGQPGPDELPSKSVGQRFFIYSGGVLMNVAFALVVFPILFTVGVPMVRPVLGEPAPGSPLWHADVAAGTEVLEVHGQDVFDFMHVTVEVALGDPERAEIVVRDEDGRTRTLVLAPEFDPRLGWRSVGEFWDVERTEDGFPKLYVLADGSAAEAGVVDEFGLIAVEGAPPGLSPQRALEDAVRRGTPLSLRVATPAGERVIPIEPRRAERETAPRIGVEAPARRIQAVRNGSAAAHLGLAAEDLVLRANGREVFGHGDLASALADSDEPPRFAVLRGTETVELVGASPLGADGVGAFLHDLSIGPDIDSMIIAVTPGAPAEAAGVRTGDRVALIDDTEVVSFGGLTELVAAAVGDGRAVKLSLERDGPDGTLVFPVVTVQPAPQPVYEYGLGFRQSTYVYRADDPLAAVLVGVESSWRFLKEAGLTLKRMFQGEVSTDNIGGIITIGAVSYGLAESGWAKLFFFLCMLSINLALLNVLPIPVLDGGHLLFLIVEKIKGSPVSDRVLGYSQVFGLVLILSLMVYVTYNDVMRWFWPS